MRFLFLHQPAAGRFNYWQNPVDFSSCGRASHGRKKTLRERTGDSTKARGPMPAMTGSNPLPEADIVQGSRQIFSASEPRTILMVSPLERNSQKRLLAPAAQDACRSCAGGDPPEHRGHRARRRAQRRLNAMSARAGLLIPGFMRCGCCADPRDRRRLREPAIDAVNAAL